MLQQQQQQRARAPGKQQQQEGQLNRKTAPGGGSAAPSTPTKSTAPSDSSGRERPLSPSASTPKKAGRQSPHASDMDASDDDSYGRGCADVDEEMLPSYAQEDPGPPLNYNRGRARPGGREGEHPEQLRIISSNVRGLLAYVGLKQRATSAAAFKRVCSLVGQWEELRADVVLLQETGLGPGDGQQGSEAQAEQVLDLAAEA